MSELALEVGDDATKLHPLVHEVLVALQVLPFELPAPHKMYTTSTHTTSETYNMLLNKRWKLTYRSLFTHII